MDSNHRSEGLEQINKSLDILKKDLELQSKARELASYGDVNGVKAQFEQSRKNHKDYLDYKLEYHAKVGNGDADIEFTKATYNISELGNNLMEKQLVEVVATNYCRDNYPDELDFAEICIKNGDSISAKYHFMAAEAYANSAGINFPKESRKRIFG
jgi:hypothetical protein